MEPAEIYDQVNKRYGSIVKSRTGNYEQTVAKAFGYTEEELAGIPEGANLGLSCGNPFAVARLREVRVSVLPDAVPLTCIPREKPSLILDPAPASMSLRPARGSALQAKQSEST